jgi:hypothetical protein
MAEEIYSGQDESHSNEYKDIPGDVKFDAFDTPFIQHICKLAGISRIHELVGACLKVTLIWKLPKYFSTIATVTYLQTHVEDDNSKSDSCLLIHLSDESILTLTQNPNLCSLSRAEENFSAHFVAHVTVLASGRNLTYAFGQLYGRHTEFV